jgi:hypothetical protein
MGKKWDGKTLKQSHITHINKFLSYYTGEKYRPNFRQKDIFNLWVCSTCGKFRHQHTFPSYRHKYTYLCKETYEIVTNLVDSAKQEYGVNEFCFCDVSSFTRSFTRMFIKNEELSLLIEAYIKLTHRVEAS